MSLTPAAIRLLAEKGLSAFDIADVAEAMTPVRNANAERQARFRANRRAAKDGVTDDNVTHNVTPPNDKGSNPPQDLPSEAKASLPRRGKSTRLPDDWQPEPLTGETTAMVAAWPVGMIERELSKFKDYWKSASGRKASKLDWQAAWRFWLTNANDWSLKDGSSKQSGNRGGSTRDAAQLALARMGHT